MGPMLIESVGCNENWGEVVSSGSGHNSYRKLTDNYAIDRRLLFVLANKPLVNVGYMRPPSHNIVIYCLHWLARCQPETRNEWI